jgi:hypothetical protein
VWILEIWQDMHLLIYSYGSGMAAMMYVADQITNGGGECLSYMYVADMRVGRDNLCCEKAAVAVTAGGFSCSGCRINAQRYMGDY